MMTHIHLFFASAPILNLKGLFSRVNIDAGKIPSGYEAEG